MLFTCELGLFFYHRNLHERSRDNIEDVFGQCSLLMTVKIFESTKKARLGCNDMIVLKMIEKVLEMNKKILVLKDRFYSTR